MAARVLAWTAAATLGVGAIAGVAYAATSTATTTSTGAAVGDTSHAKAKAGKGKAHKGKAGAIARRTVHGEFVVKGKDGKYVTTDAQRGSITAVSPTSVTVRSADGFTATYAVNADTKIRKDGKDAAIGTVKVGDPVVVLAVKDPAGKTARGLVVKASR